MYSGSGQIRFKIEGGGGTSIPSITLTSSAWNLVSVSRNGDTFTYGINGSYEDETWSVNFSGSTNRIASNYDDEYLSMRLDEMNYWSTNLSNTYITNSLYNSGSGAAYEDGE